MIENKMWVGRMQALLDIVREPMKEQIPGAVNAAGLLQLLHATDTPEEVKAPLLAFMGQVPGFKGEESKNGFYHFETVMQLHHLCDGLRAAHKQGLIR